MHRRARRRATGHHHLRLDPGSHWSLWVITASAASAASVWDIIDLLSVQCVSSIGHIIKSVCVSVHEWVGESVTQNEVNALQIAISTDVHQTCHQGRFPRDVVTYCFWWRWKTFPFPTYPKTIFGEILQLKPMESVSAYFLTTDEAIVTKRDHADYQRNWTLQKFIIWRQRGRNQGHMTYFKNFGIPSISRKRLKLETSNLAHRLATGILTKKNAKLGQTRS